MFEESEDYRTALEMEQDGKLFIKCLALQLKNVSTSAPLRRGGRPSHKD